MVVDENNMIVIWMSAAVAYMYIEGCCFLYGIFLLRLKKIACNPN
jgi:hypothetical protein